jgi:5-methylcytosine-specific restriction endonuclease McrA
MKARSDAWYAANRERKLAANAEWLAANSVKMKELQSAWYAKNAALVAANSKAWRVANPEMALETKRKWKAVNRERIKAIDEAWKKANPEALRIYKINRRGKESGGSLSSDLAEKLFELQQGKCPCCKKPLGKDYHLDHKIPLALGGTNTDDNMQLLRKTCNLQKGKKHPVDFMQQRGFLL